MAYIYEILNVRTQKRYVGGTENAKARWAKHKSEWRYRRHTPRMQKAFDDDGIESFQFRILEEVPSEKLSEREWYWADYYDAFNPDKGYNMTGPRNADDITSRARVFAQNLRVLIEQSGYNQRELAAKVGVPYDWLRRLSTAGISRPDKRRSAELVMLASFFGVLVSDLWVDGWRSDQVRSQALADLSRLFGRWRPGDEPLAGVLRVLAAAMSVRKRRRLPPGPPLSRR